MADTPTATPATPHPQRHDPTYYYATLLGQWATCTCGWISAPYYDRIGPQLEYGDHLVAVRKKRRTSH